MRGRVYFNKGDLQNAFENAKTACKLGYKDGCRDAKRYETKLAEKGWFRIMSPNDYYQILDVDQKASPKQINGKKWGRILNINYSYPTVNN